MAYTTLGQTLMVAAKPTMPCVTAAEKARADLDCRIPDVKGLGVLGLGFTYGTNTRFAGQDACAVAKLPLCAVRTIIDTPTGAPLIAMTATMATAAAPSTRPTRTPSVATSMRPAPRIPSNLVAIPPPPMPAAPLPPPPMPAAPPQKAFFGLGVGGVLVVLAVVGGGAYYLSTRKKKAAA